MRSRPRSDRGRQREDRDRGRQDRRVDRGREGEAEDEEDLVERNAEQGVESGCAWRSAGRIGSRVVREPDARRGARRPPTTRKAAKRRGRDRRQGELAEDRKEGEADLRAGQGGVDLARARTAARRLTRRAAPTTTAASAARPAAGERRAVGDVAEGVPEADRPEARRHDGARHAAELEARLVGVGERPFPGRRTRPGSGSPTSRRFTRP